jgi:uncharacterized membrane protein
MRSRVTIAGHPVHPMLIPFPLALWATSFAVDVLFYFVRHPTLLVIAKFTTSSSLCDLSLSAHAQPRTPKPRSQTQSPKSSKPKSRDLAQQPTWSVYTSRYSVALGVSPGHTGILAQDEAK